MCLRGKFENESETVIKRIRERKRPTIGTEKERRKVRNYAEEAAPVTGNARGAIKINIRVSMRSMEGNTKGR